MPARSSFSPRILRNCSRSTLLARIFCSSVNGIYDTLSLAFCLLGLIFRGWCGIMGNKINQNFTGKLEFVGDSHEK